MKLNCPDVEHSKILKYTTSLIKFGYINFSNLLQIFGMGKGYILVLNSDVEMYIFIILILCFSRMILMSIP